VAKAGWVGFVIFGSVVFISHAFYVSRLFIGCAFLMAAAFVGLEKTVLMLVFQYTRQRGYNYRNLLIAGTGRRALQFMDRIEAHNEWGLRIVGLVDDDPSRTGARVRGHQVLGTFDDVPEIIRRQVIDEIVFVVPRSWLYKVESVMQHCEPEGVKLSVALDFFDLQIARGRQTDLDGVPLLSFGSAPDEVGWLIAKRAIDLLGSAALLALLSPILGVVALLVKATSPGPVFFSQVRCGLNGRKFRMLKFRTMVPDAEAKLDGLLQHNEMSGPVFKMARDPRITPVGAWLRKFSLDELPQLLNVFRGDMSLVGPRPPLPSEVAKYDGWQRRKLSMRPGITCLWQVNGRNTITNFNEWVRLDLEYIDNWSLLLDCKILLKTVPAVVLGAGAK
jgi:exopolysaccharide biosynthesis polyprenyl glycosylphosphotransferase